MDIFSFIVGLIVASIFFVGLSLLRKYAKTKKTTYLVLGMILTLIVVGLIYYYLYLNGNGFSDPNIIYAPPGNF